MLQAVRQLRRRHCEERLLRRSNLPYEGDCFAPSGENHAGLRAQGRCWVVIPHLGLLQRDHTATWNHPAAKIALRSGFAHCGDQAAYVPSEMRTGAISSMMGWTQMPVRPSSPPPA